MPAFDPSRRRLLLLTASAATIAAAALFQAGRLQVRSPSERMLLAPMIGVIEPCILLSPDAGPDSDALATACRGSEGSAAALIEATLSALVPPGSQSRFDLGYTLPVPLLQLFVRQGDRWVVDRVRVQRLVRSLRDANRPAIVYFFSTHFASGAPIEAALASDARNLSETVLGPLPTSTYYSSAVFNWTFATTQNEITERRVEAVRAMLDEICQLEPRDIAKIKGVTLLGEVHHLFPDFESGMGFTSPYLVSDYSEASRRGFAAFLRDRYGSIERINEALGTDWRSFDAVEPPGKDIRREPLRHFSQHIDSFAHGVLPVAGWVHVAQQPADRPPRVRIYRNGELVGTTSANLGRQDVLQALPELGHANTGWRYDLDFRRLPAGIHTVDVLLEDAAGGLVQLASRQVAIMDRQQNNPAPQPQRSLPASSRPSSAVRVHVDLPSDLSSYFYNPLVPEWHAFRSQQVVAYLTYFSDIVSQSCLQGTPRYTHQIVPFTNPGWDATKFAIDASLKPLADMRLGVSLYGEPTYGSSFRRWLNGGVRRPYGMTEFHPLKPMSSSEVRAMLDRHAADGAQFLSFFLEPRWDGKLVPRGHNIFSLDPQNPRFGSATLYEAFQQAVATRGP